MERKTIIKVENLNKFFKSRNNYKIALDDVSFDIHEGDFLGIIGESGSGKTTLGKTIIRLNDASSGNIKLFGKNISNKKIDKETNLAICKDMQMIFQDPLSSLNPKMNVLRLISEPIIVNKSIKKQTKEMIQKRKQVNFLYEFDILNELMENKYNYLLKYFESYKNLINDTLEKTKNFKFTNLNSWTESFSELEIIYDYFIHSQKKVINNINDMFDNSKKIFNRYYKKIKNNDVNDLYKSYLNISLKINETESKYTDIENNIILLKKKLDKNLNDIKSFKKNDLIKNEINDLSIHFKSNYNNARISKTKKDYKYNLLLVDRDKLKYKILKDFNKFSFVNQKDILAEFSLIKKIIDNFYKDKVLELFKDIDTDYINKINNINNDSIKNEIDNILSKDLIHTFKKMEIKNEKNSLLVEDLLKEKDLISKNILELKNKKNINKRNFHQSDEYIKNDNDLKDIILKINEYKKIQKDKIDKNRFIDFKKKINNETIEVKKLKSLLKNSFKLLNKQLLEIRPSDLEKFSKSEARSLIKNNKKTMNNQFNLKFSSFKLIDFEFKKILEYYFIEEKLCSSNKYKIQFYRNDILNLLIIDKVFNLLESVGLKKEHAYRYPHEFSGGQRQRIVIARALINDPKVIIADEAVSALDVSVQAQVINMMKELSEKRKVTFLFIAHDLSMVKYICNNVLIMHNGRIVEKGVVNKIFNKPIHPYTKSLLKAIPELSKMNIDLSIYSDDSQYDKDYSISNEPAFFRVENDHEVLATKEQFEQWAQ